MATAPYPIALRAHDQPVVEAWAERCDHLGLGTGIAASLRVAMRLLAALTDDDLMLLAGRTELS